MKLKTRLFYSVLVILPLVMLGCQGKPAENASFNTKTCIYSPAIPYIYNLPEHFPSFVEPSNNLTTEQGVALGRKLYYDKKLSQGGPLEGKACASCHIQSKGFSTDKLIKKISPLPHTNLAWSQHFLWEGEKSGSLEEVMLFEISDFFQSNILLFQQDPDYQKMNCAAFGRSEILIGDMTDALAQWMRTLISSSSKYDRYLSGEESLTPLEQKGEAIFKSSGKCADCHVLPLTTDNMFHNNGTGTYDEGRSEVTHSPSDFGSFKTPTLRNIALTYPYMHNGMFRSLEEVVAHYSTGITNENGMLDPILVSATGRWEPLFLTQFEQEALIAFLHTLTDNTFTQDQKFSNPNISTH